jgi:RNA polymerase sigma-70 factor (ECF subfamily)
LSQGASDAAVPPDIESLVRAHGDSLYRFALSRVRDTPSAEDLVQDTFLAALSGLDRFRGEAHVRTFLIGILKNKIYDHFRRRSREESFELPGDLPHEDEYFTSGGRWKPAFRPGAWSAAEDDPAALYERTEFLEVLRMCLEGLGTRAARIFVLREVESLPGKAVCELMDLSESNVGVILHRTRLQLQQCIGNHWLRK